MSDPSVLYHYYSAESGLRVLQSRKVKFTPPNQFNDPFDNNPSHALGDEDLEKMVQEKVKLEFAFTMPGSISFEDFSRQATPVYREWALKARARVEPKLADEFHRSFSGSFGVFCLTEHRDNLLMWAHYAKQHEGCVLAFSLAGTEIAIKWRLRKVTYSPDRPESRYRDNSFEFVYRKGSEWKYEDEWRLLASLRDLECIKNSDGQATFLEKLPSGAITGVILGARMSDENRGKFLIACQEQNTESFLVAARVDRMQYRLNFEPVKSRS